MSFHDSRLAYGTRFAADQRKALIHNHQPLVRKIAWHVHGHMSAAIDIEDLLQIGMVALVEAAHSYEDRGFGFTNYAKLRVRGAMIDHLRKISGLTRSAIAFRKQMRGLRQQLQVSLGREPGERDYAEAAGLSLDEWRRQSDAAESVEEQPLDEQYRDDHLWFADDRPGADAAMEAAEQHRLLAAAIARLPEREGLVLQLYFVEEMNLQEIGETLNVGAARVCQIKKAALASLRDELGALGFDD